MSRTVLFNRIYRSNDERDCFFITLLTHRAKPEIPKYELRSNIPLPLFLKEYPALEHYLSGMLLPTEAELLGLVKHAGEEFLHHKDAKHFFYPDCVLDYNGFLSERLLIRFNEKLTEFNECTPRTLTHETHAEVCHYLTEAFWKESLFREKSYRVIRCPRSVYEKKLAKELVPSYLDSFYALKKFALMEATQFRFSSLVALDNEGKVRQAIIQRGNFTHA